MLSRNGRTAILTTGQYTERLIADLKENKATVLEIQRMTLEEIFLARIEMVKKEVV